MTTDFLDAHRRHLDSANLLLERRHWANADHLYGLSAECGLKAIGRRFGMQWDQAKDRPQKREDRRHIEDIWGRFTSYLEGPDAAYYNRLPAANPFNDWAISQRYAPRSAFDADRVHDHAQATRLVADLVQDACRRGDLP